MVKGIMNLICVYDYNYAFESFEQFNLITLLPRFLKIYLYIATAKT